MVYEVETIKRQAQLRSVSWSWASLWAQAQPMAYAYVSLACDMTSASEVAVPGMWLEALYKCYMPFAFAFGWSLIYIPLNLYETFRSVLPWDGCPWQAQRQTDNWTNRQAHKRTNGCVRLCVRWSLTLTRRCRHLSSLVCVEMMITTLRSSGKRDNVWLDNAEGSWARNDAVDQPVTHVKRCNGRVTSVAGRNIIISMDFGTKFNAKDGLTQRAKEMLFARAKCGTNNHYQPW